MVLDFSLWTATVAVAVVRRDGAVEPAPSMLPIPTWLLRQRPMRHLHTGRPSFARFS